MRANLVKQWRRKTVRVVRGLTDSQMDHIYWANELYCEGARIPSEVVEYGKTYVDAPVDILLSAWERLESDLEDVDLDPMEVGGPYSVVTDAQIEFAYRAKRRSLEATCRMPQLKEVIEPYLN
jgi:hypothetical protein